MEFFDENGQAITYTVTETLTYADGSTNYYTTEYSAEKIVPGKHISEDRNLTITNTLKTGSVSVSKSVETASSSTTDSTDVFTIGLVAYTYDKDTYTPAADKDGNAITYTYTVSAEVGWSHVFSDLPLGYYWSISEWTTNDGGVHSYDMSLSIDGTDVSEGVTKAVNSSNNKWTNTYRYFYLDLDSTTQGTAQVVISMTNTEEEISVDLSTFLEGTKTLTGDPGSDLTFSYTITHGGETVATGTSTVSADSTSDIDWTVTDSSAFVYSETGTYNYVIIETVTNEAGIVFDSTRYTLIVTVSEDTTDGHLIATVTMTKNVGTASGDRETTNVTTTGGEDSIVVADYETTLSVTDSFSADFTNIYDAKEASIIFRARKTLDGRTLSAGEFSVNVTEYTDENYTTTGDEDGDGYTTITRSNGADGNMGFEVVYKTAGTYYYTVTENSGSKNNVEYDDTTYYIKVEVKTGTNASGDSALQVKSAEYSTDKSNWTSLYDSSNELIYLSFTNTYKDTTTARFDDIASKTLTGRDLVEGEFTFLLVPEGTAGNNIVPDDATVATADDPYVTAGYVTVGQWYIETTNNANGGINFGSITYNQSQVGTYTYKVVEVVEDANGVTYDTGTTGKLIYVTVYYDSTKDDLLTSISTSGSGNETVTITNTYDPGTVDLYGTKVWVDGGLTHHNESEITLYVYSSTNKTNWTMVDSSTYTLTWFANGDWHIAGPGLTEFDSAGHKLYYMVSEASVSGYTTTYSTTDGEAGTIPEDYSSTNRYTITNTIEQEYMTISGTKTWVEPADENDEAPTHTNADELVLAVTRNSDSTSLTDLTQVSGDGTGVDGTYIVVWDNDAYSIYWYKDSNGEYVGLPVYDASGYTYYYNVEERYADDYADDYANYTVETDWELVEGADNAVTVDFTNRAPNDEEEDPVKTETTIGTTTPTGKLNGEAVTEETALTSGDTVTYDDVAAGDTITYSISYYNNANTSATITITDVLDRGLTFVENSASDNGVYDEATRTITWTLTVDAFASGSVTVTAKVNNNARTISSGETAATVENEATVYNAKTEHTATTNIVTNPLEDDPDKETEKGIISVTYYEDGETTQSIRDDRDDDGNGNIIVQEGDQIHYIISRYNNTNESVTFVIVDTLDEGVTYADASPGSTYYETAATVTVGSDTYTVPAHSVVWVVSTNPFSTATVQMTVTVNSDAKTATQTYTAIEPGTYGAETDNGKLDADKDVYDSYTYGTGSDTTASVANQAVAYTVGNDVVSYSNVIENPLDDDPVDQTKTEPYREVVKDTTDTDDTVTYESVDIGDIVEYRINYYNNHNTQATITIVDKLDADVELVLRSLGDTYDDSDGVYTWTLTNGTVTYDTSSRTITWELTVEPLTSGYVEFMVTVQKTAVKDEKLNPDDEGTIVNSATVTNSEDDEPTNGYTTNIVANPVDDDPAEPKKEVASSSDGADGDNVAVGNEITYEITYYNHNSESATIKIEDTLDPNVELVGATDKDGNSLYDGITGILSQVLDYVSGKVTWTFTAEAYETGTVTITVKVKDGAQGKTVNNSATVSVNNESKTTTETENPVDDDPVDPVKTETTINDTETAEPTVDGNTYTYEEVAVDDTITYTISYYNHYGEAADVTITDILDSGVTYDSSSDNGVYTSNTRTVTWTIENVPAYDSGTVTLTVKVNSTAKTITAGETEATVDNQATVTITEDDNTTSNTTNVVVNPLEDDNPTDPTKTEVEVLDDSTGKTSAAHAADSVTEEDGTTYVTYGDVGVGDVITYQIGYTNHMNGIATITIEDVLDEGVDFVSASGESDANTIAANKDTTSNYVTYATTTDSDGITTVTWTIYNVDPYGTGTVTLKVKVNENAKTTETGETEATVENSATETNTLVPGHEYDTNVVVNPLEDDEPESPTKTLEKVTYAEEDTAAASDDNENLYVHVGDTITYSIKYYNNLNETATVKVVDVLDEGVTFYDASSGYFFSGGSSVNYGGTVSWTIQNVPALSYGEVTVTVIVNDKAKDSENTYTVNQNTETTTTIDPDSGEEVTTTTDTTNYTLIYGVTTTYEDEVTGEKTSETDTTASIANQASTTVSSATVTNQATYYSVPVENPLEEEDPVDPVKTAETVEEEDVEPTVTEAPDGTEIHEYDTVSVGETVTYTISYYNHHNTEATITIEDPLDEGLTVYEDTITDGGVYDADKHTITWTLIVEPLSGGAVSFQAMVNENAKTINTAEETVATVENGATETNSKDVEIDREYKTNIVVHPIDPDDPSDPQKFVSTTSEAGVGGDSVSVGDQITYVITYYNHTNTTADVTIVDTLMDGVTFVDSDTVPYELGEDEDGLVTVTWTIADVAPYTGGTVNLTVEVGDEALTATQVENDADVTIGDNKYTTDLVVNPVDDVPQDPVKSVDVGDGETISAGDQLTYTITYYNNLGTAADVTITDKLDSDVTYVSSSDGGVYDSNTHTVTWTIEDVAAYTEDSVTLTVKVKSGATGTIKNIANVQIADGETQETVSDDDTNEVDNPISNTSTTTTSSKSSSPKTGDSFRLTLWVLLLAGSAAGLLALYFRRRNSDDAE